LRENVDELRRKGTWRWPQELWITATQLIADIGGLMELVSILSEAPGFVREDRKEMERLIGKFTADGDVLYLHHLKATWEQTLDETKKKLGRACVFLA
jgi:hypothetical protein